MCIKKLEERINEYKNVLLELKKLGIDKIYPESLGFFLGVLPSQINKDFSIYGISNNKNDYDIELILADIGQNSLYC